MYLTGSIVQIGEKKEDEENEPPTLSGSCPASLPPTTQPSQPIPAQRRYSLNLYDKYKLYLTNITIANVI